MIKETKERYINLFKNLYDFEYSDVEENFYTEEKFYATIEKIKLVIGDNELTEENIIEIKKTIDSEFQIYQKDGMALLDDYEHEKGWYNKSLPNIEQDYWTRYRQHLFSSGWSLNVLNKLEFDVLNRLMNFLGDPNTNETFNRKGLVMGDVQSGKTSNYIGLICKAADAGYKVIVLLTGMIEDLRKQTQIRVEEGFIGYDAENKKYVGVGNNLQNIPIPKSVTTRANDFTGIAGQNTLINFKNEETPFIFIIKKNLSVLKKLRNSISNINIKPPQKQINTSLLVIDDEADNASINTNDPKYDPTAINSEIRKLLELFTKSNYVGYTATPFANVFIDPNSQFDMLKGDLFPKDFIYSLSPPSNYWGPNKLFLNDNEIIQIIDDYSDYFPLKHKKDWEGTEIFPSLKEAINAFLIINAIRDINEGDENNSHRSMLINVSRFINVQENITEIVTGIFKQILYQIQFIYGFDFDEAIKNSYYNDLYNVYLKHYKNHGKWDDIIQTIYKSNKDVKIWKIPFKDKRKRLDYGEHKNGLRVIVIGGLALSRGITLEGLTISYLYRNTATFDVLLQMGRWFGYRDKPKDYSMLCKVWMLEDTKKYFEEISTSIMYLKEDFADMVASEKPPKDFGIRVRNESNDLGITSRGKMRNVKKYIYESSFFGAVVETPFISSNEDIIISNMMVVDKFLKEMNFNYSNNALLSKNIETSHIFSFLSEFSVHDANILNYFKIDPILKFIKKYKFDYFDVGIVNGEGNYLDINDKKIRKVSRSFDLPSTNTIRFGKTRRRVGGPSDTSIGLTKEQLEKFKNIERKSSSLYLIEERNPILLIYPIELKDIEKPEKEYFTEEELQIMEIINKVEKNNYVPYAIGIGFPSKNIYDNYEETRYFINERTDWENVMYKKDNEEDE